MVVLNTDTEILEKTEVKNVSEKIHNLILHNDDFNTFDFVIESLIEVCEHHPIQAEQCTFIVHYKGKCDVKKGTFNDLKPFRNELLNRGLTVTID